ncbi:hypothetical protein [Phenylobacterium sp.]|uniref:hypothetical protein n=1 Tax=Phenylobacterium sp. TaxID=1871053 RepID=UPI002733A39A|nr:hypothetical protein [Phenylobacterium sp.]MDP3660788.1 hypothetical protein [Phenylobacterium sp.]
MGSDSSDDAQSRFLFEYRHEGSEWALEVRARDLNDAKARLQTLPSAAYRGEIVASGHIPAANRFATERGYHVANDL